MADPNTIRAWCAANSPKQPILRSKAAVKGQSSIVVTTASVVGPTLKKRKAEDKKVADCLHRAKTQGAGPTVPPDTLQAFKDSPMSGIATLLDMARIASGFNPTNVTDPDNYIAFQDFVERVVSCPFLHLDRQESNKFEEKNQDYNKLIDDIVATYDGISAQDQKQIRDDLTRLAKTAASQSGQKEQTTLFNQGALNAAETSDVNAYIYYSYVELVADQKKGRTTTQSLFMVSETKLSLDLKLWPTYAELVAEQHVSTIDDWLVANTTPEGTQPVKLCVG